MPFPIAVGTNNDDLNVITKTWTVRSELNGTLKDESSIIDPVILVEWHGGEDSSTPFTLAECNYLYIPVFKRYYYIKDIRSVRNGLVEIACHVDVLHSFDEAIRENSGIVHRQAQRNNLLLDDGVLKAYQNPLIDTIEFPDGFSGHTNVLLLCGGRGTGYSQGVDTGGAGGTTSKTTSGLLRYASAMVGRPYWYGTFGNTASADLYAAKNAQYTAHYNPNDDPAVEATFVADYGKRVHDCVGLVKGYRWTDVGVSPMPAPVYVASQDVDVKGLWAQCTKNRVQLSAGNEVTLGSVVFTRNNDHCGVYIGSGKVAEARGRAYGVVESNLSDRNFLWAGVPSWCQITTGTDVLT